MWVKHLHLHAFRNYAQLDLDLGEGVNVFLGDNAQGKTNLLESMYILALSKSFRTNTESELIRTNQPSANLRASVMRHADVDLEVRLARDQTKRLLANDTVLRPKDFVGHLNVVLFTPDDLWLVKGSPAGRRRFLDIEICQVSTYYRDLLLKYQRVLQQRNQLLKALALGRDGSKTREALSVWDEQLISYGSKICLKRQKTVQALARLGAAAYRKISNDVESLQVAYKPFYASILGIEQGEQGEVEACVVDWFRQALDRRRGLEFKRGYSLVGPQRDDLAFAIDNQDLKVFGSQGQQRSAILSCRLAEVAYMYQETGHYPVVLLDDVMSELDQQRQHFLLQLLRQNIQTVVTTTHFDGPVQELMRNALVFRVESGNIREG